MQGFVRKRGYSVLLFDTVSVSISNNVRFMGFWYAFGGFCLIL
jgi:hypothetical protein